MTGTSERLPTGDTVNVAARLEQSAAPGEILIGEQTFRLTNRAVEVERRELELKGKSRPVPAYRLMSLRPGTGPSRRLDAPMVGREAELLRLREAFDDAARH